MRFARISVSLVLLATIIVVVVVVGGCGGPSSGETISSEAVPSETPPTEEETLSSETLPTDEETLSNETLLPEDESPRIVYVSLEGQILTVRPDGSAERTISPVEGVFAWPTWSPLGDRVAFSGLLEEESHVGTFRLFVGGDDDLTAQSIYVNEPGMGFISPGIPHYSLWSPDGSRLAFMASAPEGLTLFVDGLEEGGGRQAVVRTSPLWATWSADSQLLLVHGGERHYVADFHNGFELTDVPLTTVSYRVPAWNPGGQRITFISEDGSGGYGLYFGGVDAGGRSLVEHVADRSAFLWSPDGEFLAVARRSLQFSGLVYESLGVFSADGKEPIVEVDEILLAFFWSPDSAKLAYVAVTDKTRSENVMRWKVLDVREGETRALVDFRPTGEQFTMFQFFDQYAQSHTLWSPDSGSLVFAGEIMSEGILVSYDQAVIPHIIVLNTGLLPTHEVIADGFVAFWGPGRATGR